MAQTTTELNYLSIWEAGALIRSGQLSPVELTKAYLDRIAAVDGKLKAYVTLLGDRALQEAAKAESEIQRGKYRGPLHGIPMAHKDLYDTKGVRTTAQSKVYEHRVPEKDATVIAKLGRAGSVLLGKLAMHEFASGGPQTSLFEAAHNPWNLDHIPGGSSSGSGAAVAAGLAAAALGSDTGGSIRGPASFCGIVGLKPTYGLVSRAGVVALSWSLDHVGPLTRTVEDTALMLQAIAGYDAQDPASAKVRIPDYAAALGEGVRGMRIGVPRHYFLNREFVEAAPETATAVEKALGVFEEMGAHVEEVNIPSLEYAWLASQVISQSESHSFHRENLREQPENYGEIFRRRLYAGAFISSADYMHAQRARSKVRRDFAEVFERFDLLVTPTSRSTAATFEGYNPYGMMDSPSFSSPFNLTGLPAISVPCGFSGAGLPIGLQIAGKPFDEPAVLQAAYAYQQTAGWYQQRPPV